MCMILSPNWCAVTIFEYSSTDVMLSPSCLSVLSEHVTSQSKWQSVDLHFLKRVRRGKVCGQRYSEVTCAFSLIKFLQCQGHFRSEVYSKVDLAAFLWSDPDLDQWSKICLDHGASKEPVNPWPKWIHQFLWCTMIQTELGLLIQIRITPKERSQRLCNNLPEN